MDLNVFNGYNAAMQELSRNMQAEMRARYATSVKSPSSGGISKTLRAGTRQPHGIVNRITAKFAQHGVFVDRGSRKGFGGTYGSFFSERVNARVRTSEASLGKQGGSGSPAKNWINPVLDKYASLAANNGAKALSDAGALVALSGVPTTKTRR